ALFIASSAVAASAFAQVNTLSNGVYQASSPTLSNGQPSILQLDAQGNLKVNVAGSIPLTTFATGQQTATASAVVLPSQVLVNGAVITALSTNTGTIYVGPAGVTTST